MTYRAVKKPKLASVNAVIDIPAAYQFLFEPARIICSYGGRGAGGSWNIARYLLMRSMESKCRILCTREIQRSIQESVHAVLKGQIELLGLSSIYTVLDQSITCNVTGSEFLFMGLFRNVDKIKSLEGIKYCYCEEANNITDESIDLLQPTIREAGSQIIYRWNTGYPDDPIWARYVANTPIDCVAVRTDYRDNPYFNETLDKQRLADLAYRPTEYKNIWLGELKSVGRRVWPSFTSKTHCKDWDWSKLRDMPGVLYYCACDPAQHYYPAIIWAALIPKQGGGRYIWVYNEWPGYSELGDDFHNVRTKLLYTGSLADLSKHILVHDGTLTYGNKIRKRGIDTRFAKGAGSGSFFTGDTQGLVSEWAKASNGGLIWHCPYEKTIDVQRSHITDDLMYNTTLDMGAFNEPSLYISPKCKNLITSLSSHRLEEDSEAESPKYKDFSDALRILYATIEGDTAGHKTEPSNYMVNGMVPVYANTRQSPGSWMGL
jgi:hypothetical protein